MWKDCNSSQPTMYKRVELLPKDGNEILGFYIGNKKYLSSSKHEVVKNVRCWKYPDEDSILVKKFTEERREKFEEET